MSQHPFQARSRGLYKMSRISFIWPLPSSQRNFIGLEYVFHGIIMTNINQIASDDDRNTFDWSAPSNLHEGIVRAQCKIMVVVVIWM